MPNGDVDYAARYWAVMSQENFEVVRQLIAALNERDVDRYLSFCTHDIDLNTPTTPLDGETRGPEGIRKFFAAIASTSCSTARYPAWACITTASGPSRTWAARSSGG